MAITYDKDGAYIEVVANGVTYRRAIKWEDCVVSVPVTGTEKVDMAYINGSDQLVLVLEDESEIIFSDTVGAAGLFLPLTGGTLTGDLDIGAYKLKTTNLYINEAASTRWQLRTNSGAVASLEASWFFPWSGIDFWRDAAGIIQTQNVTDGAYVAFKARDSGVGLVEVARIVGAADAYFQATLPLRFLPIATASLPATPLEGAVTYDDTLNALIVFNGTIWLTLATLTDLATHTNNTTTAHGAVSAATASKFVVRDASARAKFAAPGAAGDALIKGTRVTTAELPAMTDEKIWKGTGTNVEEVDVYTDAAAVAAVEAAGLVLAAGKAVEYTTPTGTRTASGIIKTKTAGAALVFGNACYMGTDGKMEKALADDAAITIPATHMCIAVSIAENADGLFLEQGEVHSEDDSWAWDVGLSVYLSAGTPGLVTKTMPTKVTGNQVQVLGTAVEADTIYWNPSPIVVEYA